MWGVQLQHISDFKFNVPWTNQIVPLVTYQQAIIRVGVLSASAKDMAQDDETFFTSSGEDDWSEWSFLFASWIIFGQERIRQAGLCT